LDPNGRRQSDGMKQLVWRLAKDWTVRGSNPGRGRYYPQPFILALRPTKPAVKWGLGFSPEDEAAGM